jgi:predicted DNA-binding protein (MmcQ/YjbR family)
MRDNRCLWGRLTSVRDVIDGIRTFRDFVFAQACICEQSVSQRDGARMNVAAVKRYCAGKPGTTEQLSGEPWNVLVYSVGGKRYAYFKTSEPERWRFSFKVTPDRFLELTDMPGVKPARFMGRFRWVTVVDVSSMPSAYLRELVDWSYAHALASLTRAARAKVLGHPAS